MAVVIARSSSAGAVTVASDTALVVVLIWRAKPPVCGPGSVIKPVAVAARKMQRVRHATGPDNKK